MKASKFLFRRFSSYHGGSYNGGRRVVVGIVAVNVAVFASWKYAEYRINTAYDFKLLKFMNMHFTLNEDNVRRGRPYTIITSTISHMDGWHLLANMATLYFLGTQAIFSLGIARYLGLYVGAGVFASVCHLAWPKVHSHLMPYDRPVPRRSALGASGSVIALATYTLCLFPTSTVYLYMIVPVPAIVLLGGLVAFETLAMANNDPDSTTGHAAHLGGMFVGGSYFLWNKLRRRVFRR